jgi:hypothetical protein
MEHISKFHYPEMKEKESIRTQTKRESKMKNSNKFRNKTKERVVINPNVEP